MGGVVKIRHNHAKKNHPKTVPPIWSKSQITNPKFQIKYKSQIRNSKQGPGPGVEAFLEALRPAPHGR